MYRFNSPVSAAQYGDIKSLSNLLDEDNINKFVDNFTPLMAACRYNQNKCVEYILKNKNLDINLQQPEGLKWTALHYASSHGNNEAVDLLLKNKKIKYNIKDGKKKTPFEIAKKQSIKKIIENYKVQLKNKGNVTTPRKIKRCLRRVDSSYKGIFCANSPLKSSSNLSKLYFEEEQEETKKIKKEIIF